MYLKILFQSCALVKTIGIGLLLFVASIPLKADIDQDLYQLYYQLPVEKSQTLEQVQQQQWWRSNDGWISENFTQKHYWVGDTPKVAWLKLDLEQALDSYQELWIELASSGVSRAKLYQPVEQAGTVINELAYQASADKTLNTRYLSFKLNPQTISGNTVYLRVEATNKFLLQVNLKSSEAFHNDNALINFLYALGYGVLIAMALYNVTIGQSLRDPLYYVYTATILGAFLYQFFAHGHVRLFWQLDWDLVNYWLNWLAMLVTTLSLYFMYYFCNLEKYTPKIASKVLWGIKLLSVMTLLALFLPSNWSLNLDLIVISPLPIIALVISSYAWRCGSKTAKIFTIAWSFYILGSLLWINYWLGILPLNAWVEMPLLIGAALESILLSLALAYRIKLLSDRTEALNEKRRHYKKISELDALTQLANRRAFDRRLAELKNAKKEFGLLLLDIDFFKKFNDTYGHLAGDEVLVKFAEILRKIVRDGDLPVRVGGEEFAIVMPGIGEPNIQFVAERIRRQFEDMTFEFKGDQIHCTVSIGLSTSIDGESTNQMIERTDKALYIAKEQGRNRVVPALPKIA